ncbi:class I SAM-dependent methyltransferase [Aerosakkonema sp. BLCC-F183]|uniref:class I SAM-dependent methyltransferase n=1 Tax=Aerosakkonema sp. BLCC-F183 TaxID=3342834 RepID=UPI0035B99E43
MQQLESQESQNKSTSEYIHGFTKTEQERLVRQSRFIEPYIYPTIDFAQCNHILEIGCGVGAQIEILLRKYPNLRITGVDRSKEQIQRATEFLKPYYIDDAQRVFLHLEDGGNLPFANDTFDGCFICFVLEHTEDPIAILQEVRRVIQPGSRLYCSEVFHRSLYIYPSCPLTELYWQNLNEYQKELKGDPEVGIKLCNLALKVEFSDVTIRDFCIHLDARNQNLKERELFFDYWIDLCLSVAPSLCERDKITLDLLDGMKAELHSLKSNPDCIFSYTGKQLEAVK